MSVIIAILQAVLQAATYVFPVSQSGLSSIYHDFAGRGDGSFTVLFGVINIGIAIGLFLSAYKLFIKLGTEVYTTGRDIIKKDFSYSEANPARKYMLMTLISFVPMLLWLIPLGKYGMCYRVLRATAYNNTLLDDGIFLALTGGLVLLAAIQLAKFDGRKSVEPLYAAIVGAACIFFVPVSGMALIGGVFSILALFSVKKRQAFKYGIVLSVPVMLVSGIVQICTAAYKSSVVAIILALIISVCISFISARVLYNIVIRKGYLKYIGIYDIALGAITAVVGIVQLIVR